MHEDDMSFMREVFMPDTQGNDKPKLPFNQYITEWGLHPISVEGDVDGAMHKMKEKYGNHFRAIYKVPRPDGTVTEVGVISGMMFYSRKDAPYEVMVHDGRKNDPYAYQTDEDLMLLLAKLLGEDNGLSK
jgi:hypothetical protein